jgi:calcineurin-like phosphoesterase family protein
MHFGGKDVFVQHHPPEYKVMSDCAICGHVHNKWKHKIINDDFIVINVGVDVWNYEPVSVKSLLKYYSKIKNKEMC